MFIALWVSSRLSESFLSIIHRTRGWVWLIRTEWNIASHTKFSQMSIIIDKYFFLNDHRSLHIKQPLRHNFTISFKSYSSIAVSGFLRQKSGNSYLEIPPPLNLPNLFLKIFQANDLPIITLHKMKLHSLILCWIKRHLCWFDFNWIGIHFVSYLQILML